ncbi:hypothetical protein GCM10009546_45650 [Actinomadura livida]|uniref:Uncharacterized protein n=1 Tax=Actinomadura livida TaxID=79909 RepID=A0ABN1EZY3_9ACTN|nr:hypothetical protein GCM10010208_12480 [Actinomadura livida]
MTELSLRNEAITCQPLPGIPGIPTHASEVRRAAAGAAARIDVIK